MGLQFTKEMLLNDLSKVSIVTQATDKSVPTDGKALKVRGGGTFIISHMSPVWKAVGTNAVKEIAEITIPTITAGLHRIIIDIQLSGSADADYARFDAYYGKPIDVELILAAGAAPSAIAANIQKVFSKSNAPQSYKGLIIAGTTGKLTLTAGTEFQRFKNIQFQKYNETTGVFETISTAFTVTTPGAIGFGTTWTLLQNFRIPTQEATYFTNEGQDERPIAGSLYNQYTFRYEANRNIPGTGVLGEIARSVTTHVYYVLSSLASTFEGLLTGAGATVVVSSTDVQTPVDDEQGNDTPPEETP